MSSLDNCMCHNEKERRSYTMEFNCEDIEYAEKNSSHKAAKKIMLLLKELKNGDKAN